MKRILMLLILSGLSLLLLSCEPSQKEIPATESKVMQEPSQTLNVCASIEEAEQIKELADCFMEKYPDISVQVTLIPKSEYTQQMLKVKNNVSSFDCVLFPSVDEAAVWMNKDTLADIKPFIEGMKTEFAYDQWYSQDESHIAAYVLPYRKSRWAVFYNERLFDKLDVPYPQGDWTWEEFEQTAVKLTSWVGGSKTYGLLSFNPAEDRWRIPAATMGARNPENSEELEWLIKSAKWYYQLTYEKNVQIPYREQTGAIRTDYDNQFLKGNIGMYISSDWSISELNRKIKETGRSFRYNIAPLPYWEGQERWEVTDVHVGAVIKDCSYPAEAFQFIRFVTGSEGAEILARQGLIPAWNTEEIVQMYLSEIEVPENKEVFLAEGKPCTIPASVTYYKHMDVIKAAMGRYLLREQDLEHILLEIKEEVEP